MTKGFMTALAAVMVVLFLGCPASSPPDDHGHAHGSGGHGEVPVAQVTVWDERYEIFLEHRYIVANKKVNFVTHITDRRLSEPVREGAVTFIGNNNAPEPFKHIENAPSRDGIYIPTLQFPVPGEWNVSLLIPDGGDQRTVKLPAFQVYATQQDANEAATNREPAPDGIDFLKEQQWKIGVVTEAAIRKTVTERLRLAGTVKAAPHRSADITTVVAGRLLAPADGSFPTVGDQVEKGQVVALVQPPLAGSDLLSFMGNRSQIRTLAVELSVKGAEAQAVMEKAKITMEYARKAYDRTKELHEKGAKSTRELEETAHELNRARTEMEAAQTLKASYAKARAELSNLDPGDDLKEGFPVVELRAPIAGTVAHVNAIVGEHALPEEHVLQIRDTSVVTIEAKVPESDISRLSDSGAALYETPDAPGKFRPILDGGSGRLLYIGQEVDPKSRTIPLIYEVPNEDNRLRLGMAINVHVETARSTDTLVIPNRALVEDEGQSVAFVQLSGELFQKRYVKLGLRDGEHVEVLSGLDAGEQVVTDGAFAVRLASVATSIPAHGHAH